MQITPTRKTSAASEAPTHSTDPLWQDARNLCQLIYQLTRNLDPQHQSIRQQTRKNSVAIATLVGQALESNTEENFNRHQRDALSALFDLHGRIGFASQVGGVSSKDLQLCHRLCKKLKDGIGGSFAQRREAVSEQTPVVEQPAQHKFGAMV